MNILATTASGKISRAQRYKIKYRNENFVFDRPTKKPLKRLSVMLNNMITSPVVEKNIGSRNTAANAIGNNINPLISKYISPVKLYSAADVSVLKIWPKKLIVAIFKSQKRNKPPKIAAKVASGYFNSTPDLNCIN